MRSNARVQEDQADGGRWRVQGLGQENQLTSVIVRSVHIIDVEVLGHAFDMLSLPPWLLIRLTLGLFWADQVRIPRRVFVHGCKFSAKGSMRCFDSHISGGNVQEVLLGFAIEVMPNLWEVAVAEMVHVRKG